MRIEVKHHHLLRALTATRKGNEFEAPGLMGATQRAPSDRILCCGHAACDNGLATLVWQPDSNNVVEVLVITVSDEARRLLLNSRHRWSNLQRHAHKVHTRN